MRLEKRLLCIIVILLTAMSYGCSEDRGEGKRSEYDMANQDISDGNYNSAISVMTHRLQDNPRDQKARVILASAYAARAGIFMGQYFDVASGIIRQLNEADTILDNQFLKMMDRLQGAAEDKSQRSILEIFSRVYVTTFRISQMVTVMDMIPRLSTSDKRDLALAVEVLDGDENIRDGGALYSGLLRLILLKNNLSSKYNLTHLNKCTIDLNLLAGQLQDLQMDVHGIMINLAYGTHDRVKAAKMTKAADKINASFDDAINTIFSVGVIYQMDVSELTQSIGGSCVP